MTTMCFYDGVIAVDSRQTAGDTILSDDIVKINRDGTELFILSGSVSDFPLFRDSWRGGSCDKLKGMESRPCGFVVDGSGAYKCGIDSDDGLWSIDITDYQHPDAFGSGWQFALAAVDFGTDAVGAVKYAMTRDSGTGGSVRHINVAAAIKALGDGKQVKIGKS